MKSLFLLLCFLNFIVVSGCAITEPIPDVDFSKNGFATSSVINPKAIEINKPYNNIERVNFVVLNTKSNVVYDQYTNFLKSSLEKIGFKKAYTESEFAKLIIEKDIHKKIGATYDLVSLYKIYEELGEFLVIVASLNHVGDTWWENLLVITDPQASETIVKIREREICWASAQKEFFYPNANFLNDWYKSSQ
jgi:hypothetical protein